MMAQLAEQEFEFAGGKLGLQQVPLERTYLRCLGS